MLRIFLGYDSNETVAYHVLAHSILHRSSVPVSITPLKLSQLPLDRPKAEYQSTEFSFSRFLVPWLCNYEGTAIFMDCDMLARGDISKMKFDPEAAVSVVKHDYTPVSGYKFLDQPQSKYEKKNWSSVMVFNNAKCQALTPELVNKASGLHLHQFKWLEDDQMIGEIDPQWNHLVGEYPRNPNAKLVHFTLGTPCFRAFAQCEYALEWRKEKEAMLSYNTIGEFSRVVRTGT